MFRHTLLPHTADVRLKVEADTLEELFRGALQVLADLLREGTCREESGGGVAEKVTICAADTTALLIDFLSEALTLSYVKKAVFCGFEPEQLTATQLTGTLHGLHVAEFGEDVKAVTYHEADVHRNAAGNWETVLIFDI